jgi:TfoX/Sxy family transcriptional regulator of competence genes
MAYDEELAGRVRDALAGLADITEQKMFGGLAFMVNDHMACGIVGEDLLVRVGRDNHEAALSRGARVMDLTGRPMRGLVIVAGETLSDQTVLDGWVDQAVEFAQSEQPRRRFRSN